jgi:hypothetical protein
MTVPLRSVHVTWRDAAGIIQSYTPSQNDPHAKARVVHTLIPDGRYLVSPIQCNKAPKFRGRSCIFLKPQRDAGGNAKAKVQFEDDASIGYVDLNDLVPYDGAAEAPDSWKQAMQYESDTGGPVSEAIGRLRRVAQDGNPSDSRDRFRVLIASWYAITVARDGFDAELLKELNGKLYEILGLGHHVQSCTQFMSGKRGKQILEMLGEDLRIEVARARGKPSG